MSIDTSSLLLRANEGESTFQASGEFLTWKATAETTGGKYDQVELVTLPQAGPPEHTHTQDELFYFLEGTYRMRLGTQVFTLSAGDFVRVPAGVPHTWRCLGKNAGKICRAPEPYAASGGRGAPPYPGVDHSPC